MKSSTWPAPPNPHRSSRVSAFARSTNASTIRGQSSFPLDEDGVRAAVRELLSDGVESIAVSLLWSFRNPGHEQRIREIIQEETPELYVALSSEVSPRIREYARNVTTIMNTQVGPRLNGYLRPLERRTA